MQTQNNPTRYSFNFGEYTETQTSFLGFKDFCALDKIEREDTMWKLGNTIHDFFTSLGLDREFTDGNGESITDLYSLIMNEIVRPDIRKICMGKGSHPLYQKYLVLFFVNQLLQEKFEELKSAFSKRSGGDEFQKRVISICRNNSSYGTRAPNGMVASVLFYMHQYLFSESVDKLLDNYT